MLQIFIQKTKVQYRTLSDDVWGSWLTQGGGGAGGAGIDDEVTAPDSTWSSEKISEELTGKAPSAHSHSYNSLSDKPDIPDAYTHPYTHPTTILDEVDAANGAEDYYLNQKGEFKKVEAGSTETGLTIRAKLEALAGDDKLNYTALKGVVSSYTLDFRDDVTQVQDINIEGAIRIDAIQTVNVATLQLGAVTLTLPLSAPITIAQGAYNVWTITRNNASAASVGIKYTKL